MEGGTRLGGAELGGASRTGGGASRRFQRRRVRRAVRLVAPGRCSSLLALRRSRVPCSAFPVSSGAAVELRPRARSSHHGFRFGGGKGRPRPSDPRRPTAAPFPGLVSSALPLSRALGLRTATYLGPVRPAAVGRSGVCQEERAVLGSRVGVHFRVPEVLSNPGDRLGNRSLP